MNKLDEDGKLSSNGFSPSDLELLYTIGCMVGIAVENTQLLDDARVRLKELQQLQAATEAIASSLSLDDVLHNIVSYSGLPVSADYVSILIVGDKGELLTSREKFGGVIPLYERAKAQGTTDTVILGKEPVFSEDTELTWSRDASLLQAGVRAYAAFPLIIDSRVLGVLYFHYKVPTRFQNKFPLLKALVNQAAGAVQNARLYQLSQSALNLGQIISSTLKQQSSLQTVVDEMTKLIGIDQAGIVLFDDNKEFGHVVAASEREGGRMETTDRIPLRNNPSIETILSTKRPYPIYDARNDPSLQIISDLVEKWGVQSMLLVPLVAAGEVIGTLGLDAVREKRHFSPEEIGLCQLIATWLATAIKNSTLYEEAQEQRRRLQSFLGTVTTKLVKHTDLEGLYEFIVHSGAGHLNAGNCGLFLNDPEVGRLEMVAWSQSVARTSYAPRTLGSQELSDDLNARVASTGEPIQWVRDSNHAAETELRGGDIQLSASHSEDLNSLLIVPVFSADRSRIIGVLRVENKQTVNRGVGFTEFDRDLLTTLADQVAKDIDLHEDYARMRANAALGERDRLTGDLHEALNLFHSGVMVNADLAEYWLKREEYANVADRLMAVRRVAKFIVAELRHILEDLRDPVLTKSGLVVALEKYTELLGTEWIRFTSNVDVALPFDVSFALFRTAQAALHNAVKHSGVGDRPNGLVDVSLRLKNGYIILRVADNGRGFDLKATKAAYPAPYGLERMKKLAADLGEPLRIITRPDRGTIVVACTPLKEVLDAKQDKSFTC
jgi:GAF domain-containing protein